MAHYLVSMDLPEAAGPNEPLPSIVEDFLSPAYRPGGPSLTHSPGLRR